MKSGIKLLTMLGVVFVAFSQAPAAHAQATRTWVSGVGDDANPCSRTAPCKTFAGAISKTAASGEIDVLDPGGFGALTITKGITLDGGGGQVASVLVAGTNGIVVNAGTTDVITIRNLRINGLAGTASPGINGIQYLAGAALIVENCDIFGFASNAINIAPSTNNNRVSISNSTLTNSGAGLQLAPTGGTVNATATNVLIVKNTFGIGISPTGAATAALEMDRVTSSENFGNGVQVSGTGGSVQLTNSALNHNGSNGISITAPATAVSYVTNVIAANGVNNVVGTLTTFPLR
jgi:hypothetical protein